MAEMNRRSGRATKGQHRGHEEAEPTAATKKADARATNGRGKKKSEPSPEPESEEPEEQIRCVCGAIEEDEDDEGREYVQCDRCNAWQHNECMGLPTKLPKKYFCEQCRPQNHKTLLDQVAKGERPWEQRRAVEKQRHKDKQDALSSTESHKKGRYRPSAGAKKGAEQEYGHEANEDEHSSAEPDETEAISTRQKRKLRDDASPDEAASQNEPAAKMRKPSSPPEPAPAGRRKSGGPASTKAEGLPTPLAQLELVSNIEDLKSEERRRAAAAFVKLFETQIQQAQKEGSFFLVDGQKVKDLATKLALNVEYAVFLNFFGNSPKASPEYSDKFRAITFNIKANPSLRNRVLVGSLSPNELSKMTTNEMAKKELQEEKAKLLKEAEKQHTLIQEDGPRIRRTHKGEEFVNDDAQVHQGSDASFVAPVRRRPSEMDTSGRDHHDDLGTAQSSTSTEPPSARTDRTDAASPSIEAPERKSSSNFNLQEVLSGVKAPTPEQRAKPTPKPIDTTLRRPQPQQADADIDRLLKDDEPEDEDEPYSPKDFSTEPTSIQSGVVWSGKMNMTNVAGFSGQARHVAGANLSFTIPWTQLLPESLTVGGRIDMAKANEYVCQLQYSNSTDVVVVAVTPTADERERVQFDKLFDYFTTRQRYGVISRCPSPNVKDVYVVPLEAGSSKKPEYVELLVNSIGDDRPHRMLLVTFIVKTQPGTPGQQTPSSSGPNALKSPVGHIPAAAPAVNLPHANNNGQQTSSAPIAANSPPLANQAAPQQYAPPYSRPPHQAQSPNLAPYQSQHSPHSGLPYAPPPHQQDPNSKPMGASDAARHVFGSWVELPVVRQLLSEAPNLSVPELTVVREMMQNVPACQNDYRMLKGMLEARSKQQSG